MCFTLLFAWNRSPWDEKLKGTANVNHTSIVVAATIFSNEGQYEEALRLLSLEDNIEKSVTVIILA